MEVMINKLYKSILEQDNAPIVVCDIENTVVYMNPIAIKMYGKDLIGSSIKVCHSEKANKIIDKVVAWFFESIENNVVFTYHNEKENKDVYMVALRDDSKKLIGYYEKHEYKNKETSKPYNGINL